MNKSIQLCNSSIGMFYLQATETKSSQCKQKGICWKDIKQLTEQPGQLEEQAQKIGRSQGYRVRIITTMKPRNNLTRRILPSVLLGVATGYSTTGAPAITATGCRMLLSQHHQTKLSLPKVLYFLSSPRLHFLAAVTLATCL